MTQRRNVSSGSEFESIVGYSRAVRTGPYIAVAGTTGAGDDIAAQARNALRRIEIALQEAGAIALRRGAYPDVSSPTFRCGSEVGAVHAEVFGDIRPVATMVEVSALISPDLLVEIEVDAYVADLSRSAARTGRSRRAGTK